MSTDKDARIATLEARVRELEGAVRWALGEDPEYGEPFRGRLPGEPPFWWRSELRKRAALNPGAPHE